MRRSADIPLNDIMPLVDVPDYSIYFFIALSIVGTALALGTALFLLRKIRSRAQNERKRLYAQLVSVDFSDPKRAAYLISEIGHRFAQENERTMQAYQRLFERLEPYKYAPKVNPIDEETIGYYRLYLSIIDA